jgi:hypothetical protein
LEFVLKYESCELASGTEIATAIAILFECDIDIEKF